MCSITVSTLSGQSIPLSLQPETPLFELQEQVARHLGVRSWQVALLQGSCLLDGAEASLDTLGLVSGSLLTAYVRSPPILAVGSVRTVRLWDAESGSVAQCVGGQRKSDLNGLGFTPDGKRIVLDQDFIEVWDVHSASSSWRRAGYHCDTTQLPFIANGKILAAYPRECRESSPEVLLLAVEDGSFVQKCTGGDVE
eukprot:CAMPEP_0178386456 /NCGR_PEP_ID=MMETSP0689_2-20121128/8569_1 /TAXON_ID=160604 /ORGANISM="Amphidinium massartii, Strain CS-259" /LENGTH=195 /DNA_ID=CAMNT_0020006793 /DNA_START=23 /DNA_END=607 /DNA_ORIENTATION=-